MEDLENPEFVMLLRKLLATFNFLLYKINDLKEKEIRASVAEVKLKEQEIKNKELKEKIVQQKNEIKELKLELEKSEKNGDRLYVNCKEYIAKNDRLKKQIERLQTKLQKNG